MIVTITISTRQRNMIATAIEANPLQRGNLHLVVKPSDRGISNHVATGSATTWHLLLGMLREASVGPNGGYTSENAATLIRRISRRMAEVEQHPAFSGQGLAAIGPDLTDQPLIIAWQYNSTSYTPYATERIARQAYVMIPTLVESRSMKWWRWVPRVIQAEDALLPEVKEILQAHGPYGIAN